MNIEEALVLIDRGVPRGLNTIQELVVRHTWEDKTYHETAEICGYDASYIRDVGYKLWRTLSDSFGEKVKKGNLHVILRKQAQRALQDRISPRQISQDIQVSQDMSDRHSERERSDLISELSPNGSNVIDFQKAVASKQRDLGNGIASSVLLTDIAVEESAIDAFPDKLDELERNNTDLIMKAYSKNSLSGLQELQVMPLTTISEITYKTNESSDLQVLQRVLAAERPAGLATWNHRILWLNNLLAQHFSEAKTQIRDRYLPFYWMEGTLEELYYELKHQTSIRKRYCAWLNDTQFAEIDSDFEVVQITDDWNQTIDARLEFVNEMKIIKPPTDLLPPSQRKALAKKMRVDLSYQLMG
ncbi:hypothetical protein TUMEXPCC7403_21210 [Tumidithrix helvetica PCC 7403]|uniref:hypothetical protein n=1 Tax=Tumidithrix helvetica TaxID=3457545 RepID=UPI003CA5C6D4